MTLPTLLLSGNILPQKWMTKEQRTRLNTERSIDWIITYLVERSWTKLVPPKIKIKGPGSRVSVFRSGTGTGKSTVFPPAIFGKFFEEMNVKKTIICTQPTVATATDIPYQIAMYNDNLVLGETIGFQTGTLVRKPVKGVLFATIGILLQHLKVLPDLDFMRKYSFIILDEIHLRSIETDTTLFYLRRFLDRNYEHPECPYIILTSGTFEPEIFMDYFSCPESSFLDIVGSSFPIKEHYAKFDVTDYISYAVDLTEKIHLDNIHDIEQAAITRDILIFVQGSGQITDIVNRIHKLNTEVFAKGLKYAKEHSAEQQKKYGGAAKPKPAEQTYYLCPVSVTSENMQKGDTEYQNLFSNVESIELPIYEFINNIKSDKVIKYVAASRRVIVATNAIETGLTIDTLRYCIDTGYVNEMQFNPNFGLNILLNKNVTQASARQRRGRVGRKDPGEFYACYTEDTYKSLAPLPFPDIIRTDITTSLLDIIINETETTLIEINESDIIHYNTTFQMNQFDQKWYALDVKNPFNVQSLLFIQSPTADSYVYALEKLRVLGFINEYQQPTLFGWYASKIRKTDLESIRMILAGYHEGANILDLITISCMLAVGHKLYVNKNKYKPRDVLNVGESEALLYHRTIFADEFLEHVFIWDEFMNKVEEISDKLNKQFNKSANKKGTKNTHISDSNTSQAKKNTTSILKSKKNTTLDILEEVKVWCERNMLNMDVLFKVVELRDELIGDLLSLGINPFYNGLGLPRGKYNLVSILQNNLQEGVEEIRKIKKCIYEGYRLNLYIWNEGVKAYVSYNAHNSVTIDTKMLKPLTLTGNIQQARPQKIILSKTALRQAVAGDMYEFMGSDVCALDGYVDADLEFL